MGLDLTVCPVRYGGNRWWLGYTRIAFDRDYNLFGQIAKTAWTDFEPTLKPTPLSFNVSFDWYGDEGVEQITEDAYGEPLTFVFAEEFRCIETENPEFELSEWNKAVLLMLRALPNKTPVVLYWS